MSNPVVEETARQKSFWDGEWLTASRFVLLLAGFIAAFFPGILFGGRTFVFRDFGFYSYPVAHYARECFWRGEIPLWNPMNDCGTPFLAQWSTLVFYPFSLFYYLLPLSWSLGAFCLLHLLGAGLGMYLLAHHWTGHRLGAAVAGVLFTFNGIVLSCLIWPHYLVCFAWMPFVFLTVERAWTNGGKFIIWAIFAGTMQMLSGMPEFVALTWLMLGAIWIGHGISKSCAWGISFRRLVLVIAGISGLCAFQLLPFFELLRYAQRDPDYGGDVWSLPPLGLANFFLPLFGSRNLGSGVFMQPQQQLFNSYYLPLAGLMLSFAALWRAREWRVRLLAALAIFSLLLSLGNAGYVYPVLKQVFPALGIMRYPIKLVLPVIFAVSILAAYGARGLLRSRWEGEQIDPKTPDDLLSFHEPRRRRHEESHLSPGEKSETPHVVSYSSGVYEQGQGLPEKPRPTSPHPDPLPSFPRCGEGEERNIASIRFLGGVWILFSMAIFFLVWFARQNQIAFEHWTDLWQNGVVRFLFLTLASALLCLLLRDGEKRRGVLLALSLLALIWLDGVTHAPNQNLSIPSALYEPVLPIYHDMKPKPVLGESRAWPSYYATSSLFRRILSDPGANFICGRLGMFANCNLLENIPKTTGFFSLHLYHGYHLRLELNASPSTNGTLPLLDFMSVSQTSVPGEVFEWQPRPNFMPLITAGQKPLFADTTNTVKNILDTNFNPRAVVYLPEETRNAVSVTNATEASVLSKNFSSHRITARIDAKEPSLVVISQSHYPVWKAYVDEKPVSIWRANFAFQAVEVPAGQHDLKLVYEDKNFALGAGISGITLLACVGGLFQSWRTRRMSA